MELLQKFSRNAALVLLVIAACTTPREKPEPLSDDERKVRSRKYHEIANKFSAQGDADNMRLLTKALEMDSSNADVWRELSVPYLKRGLPHRWKPLMDQAVKNDPKRWMGWRGYLKLFFYRDYIGAINDFDSTDILTPNFTDYPQGMSVDYQRGLAYLGLKNFEKADDYFTRYIDEVTGEKGEEWVDVKAFIHRGITRMHLQQHALAATDFHTCLKHYNQSADAHYHLAKLALTVGEPERALGLVQEARKFFKQRAYMQENYVEIIGQIYIQDIDALEKGINDEIQRNENH